MVPVDGGDSSAQDLQQRVPWAAGRSDSEEERECLLATPSGQAGAGGAGGAQGRRGYSEGTHAICSPPKTAPSHQGTQQEPDPRWDPSAPPRPAPELRTTSLHLGCKCGASPGLLSRSGPAWPGRGRCPNLSGWLLGSCLLPGAQVRAPPHGT